MNRQKVLIFIDGENVNGMQAEMEISLSWVAFRDILTGDRERVGIRYYTTPPVTPGAKGFLTALQGMDYEVFTSKPGEIVDDLIVDDIRKMYQEADVIVLVGGDAIYAEPLAEAAEAGKEVEVVCVSTMLAGDFSKFAEIIDPSTFKDQITDVTKTRRFRRRQAESGLVTSPGAELVGQLMALGSRVTIETRPQEIIIRIRLPQ